MVPAGRQRGSDACGRIGVPRAPQLRACPEIIRVMLDQAAFIGAIRGSALGVDPRARPVAQVESSGHAPSYVTLAASRPRTAPPCRRLRTSADTQSLRDSFLKKFTFS